jgi:hypothetical protein
VSELEKSIFQTIRDELDSVVTRSGIEQHFREYVARYRTTRWGIFSDYVIGDRDRPSDAFVFTLVPLGPHLSDLFDLALSKSTPDLKDVNAIPEPMLEILRDPRFYTFCFSLKKGDGLSYSRQKIESGALGLIGSLRRQGVDGGAYAKNFSELLTKVRANSFSTKLFSDIVFTASIVSYLIGLISRAAPIRPDRIGWFSDRDKITTAYGELVKHLMALEVQAVCVEQFDGWRGPSLGVNEQQPGELWCDGILRVPDYLAGTLSILCFDSETMSTDADKFVEMLQEVMAGRRSIRVFRASLSPDLTVREMIFNPLQT